MPNDEQLTTDRAASWRSAGAAGPAGSGQAAGGGARRTVPAMAWAVWSVGIIAYIVAVLHRTSFGVAGLDAADRFHASAGALAVFTMLQILVYAGLQVPVGMLLDRVGPRRMVAGGALLMAAGQVLLAYSTGIGTAIVARVLVGAGDAMTFIPARRAPCSRSSCWPRSCPGR